VGPAATINDVGLNESFPLSSFMGDFLDVEEDHHADREASASPVTDGEHVFAFFGSRGLYCLDTGGKLLWKKNLGEMHTKHGHGEGSSPALHGETLIVNWDHEEQSFLVALDKRTGTQRWRVARAEDTSWATPIVVEHAGKTQVIVSGTNRLRGYDLLGFGMKRVLLSWSSGKDSAWTLHVLRQQTDVELVGLLTTFNEAAGRVAMHAVRRELVEAQAAAAGLPLWSVALTWPCSNAAYEAKMHEAVDRARRAGVTHIAFGDLFLVEIRAYRERQLAGTGIEPLFPIWGTAADTPALAREMLATELRAVLTCVDPKQLERRFVGRWFDANLLTDLPASVDPCGERGEFHTFCFAGPMFAAPIAVLVGEATLRDGFWFVDLLAKSPQPAVESRIL